MEIFTGNRALNKYFSVNPLPEFVEDGPVGHGAVVITAIAVQPALSFVLQSFDRSEVVGVGVIDMRGIALTFQGIRTTARAEDFPCLRVEREPEVMSGAHDLVFIVSGLYEGPTRAVAVDADDSPDAFKARGIVFLLLGRGEQLLGFLQLRLRRTHSRLQVLDAGISGCVAGPEKDSDRKQAERKSNGSRSHRYSLD